jgi:hypothetical protein
VGRKTEKRLQGKEGRNNCSSSFPCVIFRDKVIQAMKRQKIDKERKMWKERTKFYVVKKENCNVCHCCKFSRTLLAVVAVLV